MSWIKERRKEKYYRLAKKEGYRSRASYKLIQINDKFHIIRDGINILDLGSSPGGWSQVISELNPHGKNLAVDIIPMEKIDNVNFIRKDIMENDFPDFILSKFGEKFNLILSDILMKTSGDSNRDHANSYFIAKRVFDIALKLLQKNGHLVVKMLQGDLTQQLIKEYSKYFREIKITKPPSSSPRSPEIYILAFGFSGS
jgi:23S rRNA methylase